MNQNENMGVEITLTEEDESITAMYDLSPEDFAALTATATVLDLDIGSAIEADTCVQCAERAEHWFQLQVIKNAEYSFSADVCVGARLYDAYGNLLASDNDDGAKNGFLIDYELDELTAYYLRVIPKLNHFMRFNTVVSNTVISVESINMSPTAVTLMPGETVTLSASVVPQNATWWRLIWSSSDNNVVQVGQSSGEVTAVSLGTAIIYAEAMDDSGKRAICTVTVVNLKENVEYHIVAFAGETNQDGNQMALHVWERNDRRLYMDTDLCLRRYSHINRQKWLVKNIGGVIRLYSQDGDDYVLGCDSSNKAIAAKTSHQESSNIVCVACDFDNQLYRIQDIDRNLFLTAQGNDVVWENIDNNIETKGKQIWKFVKKPENIYTGVDRGEIPSDETIRALSLGGEEFVGRYYSNPFNEWKILTEHEKEEYKKRNIKIVSVYQSDGRKVEDYLNNKGQEHAQYAVDFAQALGQPQGTAIYFAVDYDALSDIDVIDKYFELLTPIVHNAGYEVGVYGRAGVCKAIKPKYAKYSWLSCSESDNGSREAYEDYDKNLLYNIKQAEPVYYNGDKFDDDVAIDSDYGQWTP